MRHFDVFNGDADGICAVHQLRLARPVDAAQNVRVTGVKRDIALLDRVKGKAERGDRITVFDISYDQNARQARALLEQGVAILYFDHHSAQSLAPHPLLEAHIDASPAVCTSLLVDAYLQGAHRIWAGVAAFGDNLAPQGEKICGALDLSASGSALICELGQCLNYNAYGDSEADLFYPPAALYACLKPYTDPFEFIEKEPVFERLKRGLADDLAKAFAIAPQHESLRVAVYALPDSDWSRRVSGAFANRLAQRDRKRAHAIVTHNSRGQSTVTVSVRAPLDYPCGANDVCAAFAGGGGRAGAAGINALAEGEIPALIEKLEKTYAA